MIKKNKRRKKKAVNKAEKLVIPQDAISFENKIYNLDKMSIEDIKKLKSKLEKYKSSIETKLEALVE